MVVLILYFKNEKPQELDTDTVHGLFRCAFLFCYIMGVDEALDHGKKKSIKMPKSVSSDDFKCIKRWLRIQDTDEKGADLQWWNTLSDDQKKRMLSAAIKLEMPKFLIKFICKQLEEEKLV